MGRRTAAASGRGTAGQAPNLTLDAGALIALERGNDRARALLGVLRDRRGTIAVPAGSLAQAWRGSTRQHTLHLLVGADDVAVVPLDAAQALAVGVLLSATGTKDVVDASVIVTATDRGGPIVTSDPDDLRRLDPTVPLVVV
jgi:hypothetical protein